MEEQIRGQGATANLGTYFRAENVGQERLGARGEPRVCGVHLYD